MLSFGETHIFHQQTAFQFLFSLLLRPAPIYIPLLSVSRKRGERSRTFSLGSKRHGVTTMRNLHSTSKIGKEKIQKRGIKGVRLPHREYIFWAFLSGSVLRSNFIRLAVVCFQLVSAIGDPRLTLFSMRSNSALLNSKVRPNSIGPSLNANGQL